MSTKCSMLALQNAPLGSVLQCKHAAFSSHLSANFIFVTSFGFGFLRFHCTHRHGIDYQHVMKAGANLKQ